MSDKINLTEAIRSELQSRVRCGASVNELAKLAGVPQPVLSRFINRRRGITLETASKLTQMLGLETRVS